MENIGVGMPFYDLGQTRAYPLLSDFHDFSVEKYPVGFMDLRGGRRHALIHTPLMQFPATPNSSSSEAVNAVDEKKRDDEEEEEDGEEQKHKTNNKRFKPTKSSEQTKMKVPKVTFITKSQVLYLEDGYKWRKYGQKPVKNSPFPRNYFRCTTSWCEVKKRVERSFSDPSTVITTYEGQHTHPPPGLLTPKGDIFRSNGSASKAHFGLPTVPPLLLDYNSHQQQQKGPSYFETEYYIDSQEKRFHHDYDDDDDHDHVVKRRRTQDLLDGAGLAKDHGLLQDVVSSHIIKQERHNEVVS